MIKERVPENYEPTPGDIINITYVCNESPEVRFICEQKYIYSQIKRHTFRLIGLSSGNRFSDEDIFDPSFKEGQQIIVTFVGRINDQLKLGI